MARFLDYRFEEVLHEGAHSTVHRALDPDGHPVVVKAVVGAQRTARRVERLRHEHAIAKKFDYNGIVKVLGMVEDPDGVGLVMEDGGEALSAVLHRGRLALAEAVRIGLAVAETLGVVHGAHVIHKDVKPSNLVRDPLTGAVRLIDFSIATELSGQRAAASDVRSLEGTLAYVSPEQTGRMNRLVDFRTDHYSFGVTLFELCTGRRPFPSTDPMELVHAHIALSPPSARAVDPAVPDCLSEVIAKLLSKAAEDRYQSTAALVADLRTCLAAVETGEEPADFVPGADDHPQRLQVSQRLYGRERDVAKLMAAFERVATAGAGKGDTELLLVAGYSGIGKSALVNEVHRPIVARRGYFISGKFDQFNRNIPYASLILAFQALVGQLLTESDEELAAWREKLTAALGPNGQVIIDVIPEVELVIGPQQPVAELGVAETRNRFNHCFASFVRVFASAQRPLVVFLDDLQWADVGSLHLISVILDDPEIRHVLLIGAYRDNEVDASHPLMITLGELGEARRRVQTIALQPLSVHHVRALIADSLGEAESQVESLAALVMDRTRGNPFFVIQLLLDIYHQGHLRFEPARGGWSWDLEALEAVGITDNVVDLMVGMVDALEGPSRRLLPLAACIGSQFDLALLSRLAGDAPRPVADLLWPALEAGLVVPLSDDYKVSRVAVDFDPARIRYRFLHDRVQQASYALLSEDERAALHLQLARLMLGSTDEDSLDERIFAIVAHLNQGLGRLESAAERTEAARLNLRAAQRARSSTAYAPALACAQAAVSVLAEDAWETDYALCLDLYSEVVDLLYLTLDFEAAEAAATVVLERARDVVDTIRVYEIRIQYSVGQNKMHEAIATVKEVLAVLGVELTDEAPGELDLAALDSLPPMTDPRSLAAMRILMSSMPAIYIAATELLPAVSYAMVRLTVAHGVSRTAPYAWSLYSLVLTAFFGRFEEGFAFGRLALRELERTEARELESKVYALVYIFVYHWTRHVREALPGLLHGVKSGIETGDVEYAGYNCVHYATFTMFVGEELTLTDERLAQYVALSKQLRQDYGYYYIRIWRQLALAFKEPGHDRRFITGEVFDEHTETEAIGPMMPVHCSLRTARGWLRYLFGDAEGAVESLASASEVAVSVAGFVTPVLIAFYQSLALLAAARDRDAAGRSQAIAQVAENLAQLETWAQHQAANNAHKVSLVRAERCRLQGDTLGAIQHYEAAITGARTSRYLHEEALAFELAGDFYAEMGSAENAAHHHAMAYDLYGRWGAEGKRASLAELHPELSRVRRGGAGLPGGGGGDTLTVMTTASTAHEPQLDMGSVVKASQALAGEIKLHDLVEKLMRIVVENVGAQTGVLLLDHDGELRIEARHDATTGRMEFLSEPATDGTVLPQPIVQFVQRTRRSQVVYDASLEPQLASDPYVSAAGSRSILCAPILQKGRLTGLFYFENKLIPGAFTRDRLEVLSMLSAQVAISIENARLYTQLEAYNRNLESTVEQRTQELRSANEELQRSIDKIKKMQRQIVVQAKLASLGTLTAGIAHELRNPLNFVNNFSAVQVELADDLEEVLGELGDSESEAVEEARELISDLKDTSKKVLNHGKRAASIIDNMLRHAHGSSQEREQVDINELLRTNVGLAYHGARAKNRDLVMDIVEDLADGLPPVKMSRSDIGRVIVNIVNNACDATAERAASAPIGYRPQLQVKTRSVENGVEIRIRDNGTGIPESVLADVFSPFFTTKPPGEGTGLGLSLSHDIIVQGHRGSMVVDSVVGEHTEFVIQLPLG
jgi:predicted ATPase/signal transduction histidine kinase/tRNA A-37 threonylcarbamoyl transferase component Bud32